MIFSQKSSEVLSIQWQCSLKLLQYNASFKNHQISSSCFSKLLGSAFHTTFVPIEKLLTFNKQISSLHTYKYIHHYHRVNNDSSTVFLFFKESYRMIFLLDTHTFTNHNFISTLVKECNREQAAALYERKNTLSMQQTPKHIAVMKFVPIVRERNTGHYRTNRAWCGIHTYGCKSSKSEAYCKS